MLRSKSSLPPPHPVSYKESKAKDPEIRGHSMYLRGEHRVRCLELWGLELFCLVCEHHLIQTGKCLHSVAVKDQVMTDFILWDQFCFIQNCYFSNLKSSLKACMCVQLDTYVSWWACGGQKTTLNVGLHHPPIETRSPIIGCYVHQAHWWTSELLGIWLCLPSPSVYTGITYVHCSLWIYMGSVGSNSSPPILARQMFNPLSHLLNPKISDPSFFNVLLYLPLIHTAIIR